MLVPTLCASYINGNPETQVQHIKFKLNLVTRSLLHFTVQTPNEINISVIIV